MGSTGLPCGMPLTPVFVFDSLSELFLEIVQSFGEGELDHACLPAQGSSLENYIWKTVFIYIVLSEILFSWKGIQLYWYILNL